ncbi:MAG: hypothetical protein SPI68_09970 [Candidatus Faecousia sp.]|nr:hypothetical protein [Candidatus Faecousia sp.]
MKLGIGVHRPDRGQAAIAAQERRGGAVLNKNPQLFSTRWEEAVDFFGEKAGTAPWLSGGFCF